MKKVSFLTIFILFVFFGIALWKIFFTQREEKMIDLIPRKVLFGNPERAAVSVSPDAGYIAFSAPHNGVMNIFVMPISGKPEEAEPVTFDTGKGITSYVWSYMPNQIIYSQDTDGDENTVLYQLDIKTKSVTQITQKGVKSSIGGLSQKHPKEILFVQNARNPSYFDVVKFNLETKDQELIFQNDEFASIITDNNFLVRFTTKMMPSGDMDILMHSTENDNITLFRTIKFEDIETFDFLDFNHDDNKLFMLDSSDEDKAALYSFDFKTGIKSLIAQNDKADICGAIFHPKTLELQAYIHEYDRSKIEVLDPSIHDDIEYLSKLASGDLNIVSRSLDDKIWIVAYDSDVKPLSYYKYDKEARKAVFLFTRNSELAKHKLNKMYPVIINARDGLNMVSYLTLPHSVKMSENNLASKSAPLILYVHGGPVARDSFGYDGTHQWLSNRGYAVLSVNYRASSGFGKEFIRKGDGQWSKKMHDDLLDAVEWAISAGVTTRDQVGIYGGSYGGYAALVGLTMTPDVFACGIDLVGPSNLQTLYNSIPPYWKPYEISLRRRFGLSNVTKDMDEDILSKISPLTYVDNIKRPILIAHGANDPRVKVAESEQIVNKMKEKHIPYSYLLYPNEGHGFSRPENRIAFYAYMEQFLANIFHHRFEPAGTDLQNSSVILERHE